ncbi:type IV secretion protein Dot [Legionella bononiensis]|uniref:Type IV secretion protein Dot n=1 Tax=Legionella bononiensis TaxID=2793102 RepID=A0ABS1WFU3_9GAMM|nr:type IV secretion protein Dot [Legionella bononiensis]MBL7481674.1 type IV secretion protein Dot [Legionella bononiensis]MBL7528222.1 type IV secretion protein Dot [Legionella bononiensis]MBL7562697.1 type IV secretion protein Dot [Legionella bononiensis]
MALSEIIINDVVKYQTNEVISESSYHTLRQYLLERKPLLTVTNAIDSFLNQHYSADKQNVIEQLVQAACDSQKANDAQEARTDEQEKNSDTLLRSNYGQELSSLQSKLTQLETTIYQQNNFSSQLQSQVSEYQINLKQVERSIERVRAERNAIQTRYVVNPGFPQPNVHVHTHNGPQVPNLYPVLYSMQDQINLDSLLREENRLVDESQRLKELIRLKSTDSAREGYLLGSLNGEKSQTESRLSFIKKQLDVELPKREQQRYIRTQERLARENARNNEDPNLLQLSSKNREILTQKITAKIDELDQLRTKLTKNAVETSYSVYVSQLEEALQGGTDLKLSHYEREALKSITVMMKSYLEMMGQEQTIIKSLDEARNTLKHQQKSLGECTATLQHYVTSNPQLKQTNKDLAEDNRRLKLDSESAGTMRSNALYASLFGGASTLISAAIIGSLVVSPLFFVISGALALATVISLTVAVVYHFQKSATDDRINKNANTISEHEALISKQDTQADNLRTNTIPGLKMSIEESEQTIRRIENQLKEQQFAMKQLFTKAQNVNGVYTDTFQFFGSMPSANASSIRPSAPDYDLSDQTTDYQGYPPQYEVDPAPSYPYSLINFNQSH